MLAYRGKMQSALDGLDATDIQEDWRPNNRSILKNNITFMDECLAKRVISFAALHDFSQTRGYAGVLDPHHFRSLGGRVVLW